MNAIPAYLFAETANSAGLFADRNLALLLWCGLAVLTLALLILMRTRWGQAKPLSKCIVLSVFAHILFVAYAYGTRLIFDHPTVVEDVPIRLAMVASEEDQQLEQRAHSEPMAWDRYASGNVTTPSVGAPQPQTAELQVGADPQRASEPDLETQPQPEALPSREPERPVPDLVTEEPSVAGAAPSEVPVEFSRPEPQPQPQPLLPADGPLPRRSISQQPTAATPPQLPPASPSELFDGSPQLQRLSDVSVAEQADAAPDLVDVTAASDNRSPDQVAAGQEPSGGSGETLEDVAGGLVAVGAADQTVEVAMRRRLGDGAPLPELYRLRAAGQRDEVARRYGGSPETEAAVDAALAWLVAHQHADGHWDADHLGAGRELRVLGHDRQGAGAQADTGITGLALLALLGAGHSHFEGEYRQHVQRGLEYLLRRQQADGNLAGDARLFARMYCHGIASLALSESYALTGDYRLQPSVQRAIEYTIRSQHPTDGGWRYQPGDRGDMSQFGWQLMALKSAELAGIKTPGDTRGECSASCTTCLRARTAAWPVIVAVSGHRGR